MPVFSKPQFNSVWASTGVKISPTLTKINQGWVVEIPPHEYDNWNRNRADQMLAHLNQMGIPVWDATVEYQANKSYVQGTSTGTVYRCLVTNMALDPELDIQGNWQVAFQRSGEALLKAQNLADVPDKAQARTNLGIASTADYDLRYLVKTQNLADVPNKSSARGNLEVFSRQEVIDLINNMQPAGEICAFGTPTAPSGWLIADGSIVSRVTFSRLFAAIGTRFGAGNGSTTFQLPDLRGEFIRGFDGGKGVDIGRLLGSLQNSQNLLHSHAVNDPGHTHLSPTSNGERGPFEVPPPAVYWGYDYSPSAPVETSQTGISIASTGGSESRPRNIALLYCIRT